MCYPLRRRRILPPGGSIDKRKDANDGNQVTNIKLSDSAKQTLRDFVLDDLEKLIDETKREIQNLRIAGFHHKAEQKRQSLRFFWELWNELNDKITNIEEETT